ncbi:hypothetical protein GOODEAATRI_004074 [Goodea atripinnis]|uniref:Secreted protein n=1 Tax=Goodea atripinnis TaxID=208336 RepID=A0ABV0N7Q0_9TELE
MYPRMFPCSLCSGAAVTDCLWTNTHVSRRWLMRKGAHKAQGYSDTCRLQPEPLSVGCRSSVPGENNKLYRRRKYRSDSARAAFCYCCKNKRPTDQKKNKNK